MAETAGIVAPEAKQPPLMTAHEFAAEVQVSIDTVRRWARTGVGPRPVRLGCRAVRYRRVDVDAWIATGSAA